MDDALQERLAKHKARIARRHAELAERTTEAVSAVVGHVAVHRSDPPAQPAVRAAVEVSRLFVAPPARRHGVGGQLLDRARRWAAENQVDLILDIVAVPRSAAAMALYESTGWRRRHTTTATWTTGDGTPVRLHRYTLSTIDGQSGR